MAREKKPATRALSTWSKHDAEWQLTFGAPKCGSIVSKSWLSIYEMSSPKQGALNGPNQTTSERADIDPTTPYSIDKQRSRYWWKLILDLPLPFSVQALDATIIAGALPFIASDFSKYPMTLLRCSTICPSPLYITDSLVDQLSQLNWIVSAFNLTSATFISAWGQFAEVLGRYTSLQKLSQCQWEVCCAQPFVTPFTMMVVGRALQGVGCAGPMIVSRVILADKLSQGRMLRSTPYSPFLVVSDMELDLLLADILSKPVGGDVSLSIYRSALLV